MYNSKRIILQDLRFRKRGSKPDTKMWQRQGNVSYNGNICYIRVLIHNYTGAKDVIRYTRVCLTGVTLWLI